MNNFEQDVKNSLMACWEDFDFREDSTLQRAITNFYVEQIKNFSEQDEQFLSYFNFMDDELEVCSLDEMTINYFGENTSTVFYIYFILLNKNRLAFIQYLIDEMNRNTCFHLPVYFVCQCDFCNFTKEEQALLKELNEVCDKEINQECDSNWIHLYHSRIEDFNKNKEELLKERVEYDQLNLWDMAMYS